MQMMGSLNKLFFAVWEMLRAWFQKKKSKSYETCSWHTYELLFTSWKDERLLLHRNLFALCKGMWFLISVPPCTLFPLSRPQWEHLFPTFLCAVLDPSCGGAKFRYVNWDITCPPPRNPILYAFFFSQVEDEWGRKCGIMAWGIVWIRNCCSHSKAITNVSRDIHIVKFSAVYSPNQWFFITVPITAPIAFLFCLLIPSDPFILDLLLLFPVWSLPLQ